MEETPSINFEEVKEGSAMEFFTLKFKKVMERDSIRMNGHSAWIGDPCYVPGLSDRWHDFLDAYWEEDEDGEKEGRSVVMDIDGHEMVLGGTANGDGCYPVDGAGGSLGVDAGLLCVVPCQLFSKLGLEPGEKDYGGSFVDDVKGDCWIDDNHTLIVGDRIRVHTQEMCYHCKETIFDCRCERCEYCNEVEDWDCCCDKCDDCGYPSHDCECETCDECGYRVNECMCEEED